MKGVSRESHEEGDIQTVKMTGMMSNLSKRVIDAMVTC